MKNKIILLIILISIIFLYGCAESSSKYAESHYAFVEYNGNGAEQGIVPKERLHIDPGEPVYIKNNIGNFEKTGYVFDEWNTSADGSGKRYKGGLFFLMGEENITLYAQWKIEN